MFTVISITSVLVLLAVGVHYNALLLLSGFLRRRKVHVRRWVAVSILGLLFAHVLEVSIFAIGYEFLDGHEHYGSLKGYEDEPEGELYRVYWYFSFVAYTSLGFGDIVPTKWLRMMTALETLTGLILIAWSASFLFMQMQRFWDEEPPPQ
ncbi:MAG: two pore domain potassium channel family protein [Planctomycetes bacterium]|nr:two pore domain potassium channel family protein [Planctomycetota bacterium]